MTRSNAVQFDADVARPLSERGRVRVGPYPAAPAGPSAQIEQSKEHLARDLVEVKARLGGVKSGLRRGARTIATALGVVLLSAGIVVIAAIAASAARRARRRSWWRAA